jgi:hypothetical protein
MGCGIGHGNVNVPSSRPAVVRVGSSVFRPVAVDAIRELVLVPDFGGFIKREDQRNWLLDAVDALSLPQVSKVIQDGPLGSGLDGQKTVRVELPPLLTQLDEAIRGTIGIGGSGSLASQRNMLDADALYRFTLISTTVKEWARLAKATVAADDAAKTLRAWYAKYEDKTAGAGERFHVKKMNSWKAQILAKLDPPRVRELLNEDNQSEACPICGATEWWNPDDPKLPYRHPLVVLYKPYDAGWVESAQGMCRACGEVWSVRQLKYDLEQAEKAKVLES